MSISSGHPNELGRLSIGTGAVPIITQDLRILGTPLNPISEFVERSSHGTICGDIN